MVPSLCFLAGVILTVIFIRWGARPYWIETGFVQGAQAEQYAQRTAEHKFRLTLWDDEPQHAAAILIGEIHMRFQPKPEQWQALALTLTRKFPTSKGSPKSKEVAR